MAKHTFFLLSEDGSSLFLARRLQAEGHRVQFYTFSATAKDVGVGLVPRATTPTPPKGAVVIFDGIGRGALGSLFRARGMPVIGGNAFDVIEKDRALGAQVMRDHDIPVPETHPFDSIEAAQKWLARHEGEWFMKVSGDHSTTLTYNAPDAETMIRYLEWAKGHIAQVKAFELQRKIEGTEVSCEGWFDGSDFVPPFNCTIEDKQFLAGDLGPRTGCEANVVWPLEDPLAHLPRAVLVPLRETLIRKGVVGSIDLNMILDRKGVPHGIEWTAFRLGFDAFQAYCALLGDHIGEQLAAFARRELDRWVLPTTRVALTLRVSTPPYPTEDRAALARVKGLPLDPALLDDDRLNLADVRLDERKRPVLAGKDGWVVTICAVGSSLQTLRDEVLECAEKLVIPSSQYRIDPVERAEKAWEELDKFGVLGNRHLRKGLDGVEEETPGPGPLEAAAMQPVAPPSTTVIVTAPSAPEPVHGDPFLESVDAASARMVKGWQT